MQILLNIVQMILFFVNERMLCKVLLRQPTAVNKTWNEWMKKRKEKKKKIGISQGNMLLWRNREPHILLYYLIFYLFHKRKYIYACVCVREDFRWPPPGTQNHPSVISYDGWCVRALSTWCGSSLYQNPIKHSNNKSYGRYKQIQFSRCHFISTSAIQ